MSTVAPAYVDLPGRGLRLAYRDWGGDGPPLVLLHGLSSNARIFDWVAPLLTEKFRVVAIDQRGHGLSDKPDDGYDFESVTADAKAAGDALRLERPMVAGHSWGAGVALEYAARYPDDVRGVVLIDGGYIDSFGNTWEEAEKQMLPPEIDGTPVSRFLEMMKRWPSVREAWSEDLGEMILSNFDVRDGKIYRHLSIPNHMKIARAIFDSRPVRLLDRVTAPVLIIPSMQEPTNEMEAAWSSRKRGGLDKIREEHPNVRIEPLEDTIHDSPLQRPRELAGLILNFGADVMD